MVRRASLAGGDAAQRAWIRGTVVGPPELGRTARPHECVRHPPLSERLVAATRWSRPSGSSQRSRSTTRVQAPERCRAEGGWQARRRDHRGGVPRGAPRLGLAAAVLADIRAPVPTIAAGRDELALELNGDASVLVGCAVSALARDDHDSVGWIHDGFVRLIPPHAVAVVGPVAEYFDDLSAVCRLPVQPPRLDPVSYVRCSRRCLLSGLARKFAHVSREGGQAASEVGWVSVLARSLWRSSRVNFHWKGAAICS